MKLQILLILSILTILWSTQLPNTVSSNINSVSTTTPLLNQSNLIKANSLVLPYQVILTPNITSYKQIAPNCYSAIVNMTVTNNSTTIQYIDFQFFKIVVVQPNQIVGNNTINSFHLPNNKINTVTLFPPMLNSSQILVPLSVIMEISFNSICLPPNTNPNNDIHLIFFDTNTFKSWLPTFGAGNTITWS
jgi:hypothetical protein